MNDNKTTIHMVPEPRKSELVQATYGIIGCMQQVHNQLGPGLPEYIYQEALATELAANGFTAHKELQFHPTFRGKPMDAYLKMDLVVESPVGNVIVECKALTQLTEREHYQTFVSLSLRDGLKSPIPCLSIVANLNMPVALQDSIKR